MSYVFAVVQSAFVEMDYEYDIFISYRRHRDTLSWMEKQFIPRLEGRLFFELGRHPVIFYDKNNLACGDTWPVELGEALGKSRMLIALWCGPFRSSVWCAREVAEMKAREEALNLRTPQNQSGVIAVCKIHNGPPEGFGDVQQSDLIEHFDPYMGDTGDQASAFYRQVTGDALGFARMIREAPPFDPAWPTQSAQAFYEAFHRTERPSQTTKPSFTGAAPWGAR